MYRCSFIIASKPDHLPRALQALLLLSSPHEQFEIIVTYGYAPSTQRNRAAAAAQGDILFFLDDDSIVQPDCLETCLRIISDQSVAAVGGPSLTPHTDSSLQQLFGMAISSVCGSGGVRNRYRRWGAERQTSERELILCNLALRRELFLEYGGFDERMYPNEENLLLDRLVRDDWKLIHAPGMAVERSQRSTVPLFARQMFSYGRGRARQTLLAGPGPLTAYAPLGLLFYLALLPLLLRVHQSALIPFLVYCAALGICTAAAVISHKNPRVIFLSGLVPLMHASYGIGLVAGFIAGVKQPVRVDGNAEDIEICHIKHFEQSTW